MKLSDWTYDAVFDAVILLAFWACSAIIVLAILFILYWFLNLLWELIQDNIWWPIFVRLQDHKEKKWNEKQRRRAAHK